MSEQHFQLHNIYLKDSSLEVPNAPEIFKRVQQQTESNNESINLKLEVSNETKNLDDTTIEATMTLTVNAHLGEDIVYVVEVEQAGIFTIAGFDEAQADEIKHVMVPDTLFPYATQAIASLTENAGFPQVLLSPMNFYGAYHSKKRQEAEQAQGDE